MHKSASLSTAISADWKDRRFIKAYGVELQSLYQRRQNRSAARPVGLGRLRGVGVAADACIKAQGTNPEPVEVMLPGVPGILHKR